MRKIKLFTSLCLIALLSLSFIRTKAYDSIDSTGQTEWNIISEEEQNQYGVYYSHQIGKPKTNGANGTEKNVNFFNMKADGVNSKLVTWMKPNTNATFGSNALTKIAADYEKNHPGWIVVAGVNADQWYYGTTISDPKGGYFYYKNQTYYPFTVDGQNLFTINPLGGSGNGVAITNNPDNPIADVYGSTSIELQIYDESDNLIKKFNVAGYNKTPGAGETTVWSGYFSPKALDQFVDRENVTSTNGLYVIENSELAYMNNTRDYEGYEAGIYRAVDSFYGRGTVSAIKNTVTLTKGQFAIETTNEEVKKYLAENVKVIVEQQYATEIGNNVESVSGYHTVQVKNGVYQSTTAPYNTGTRPRSMFGILEDGSYFLMTTRDVADTSVGGTVHTETNAILNYYGAYTCYQHDGGGSVTAIYRNTTGGFDVASESCDSGTRERALGSGLFFVVRDPGFDSYKKNSTSTSVTFTKKVGEYYNEMENVSISIGNQTVELEDGKTTITLSNLEPNKEYEALVEYTYKGTKYQSTVKCETKAYDPGINIIPNTYGFTIKRNITDSILKTIKVEFNVDDMYTYVMPDVDSFELDNLFKGETYSISYICTVENRNTKEIIKIAVDAKEYTTLSYELPEITKIEEGRKTDDTLRISYAYTDNDSLVTKAYIYLNNTKYELTKKSGSYTFEDLDFNNNTYNIKIVLTYIVDEVEEELESDLLTYEKPACVHEYDNDCDATCNLCSATRDVEEHKWVNATCTKAKHCSVCNLEEGTLIPHTEVVDKGYDATCEKTGLTDGSHCSVCNEVIKEQKEIKKAEHTWVDATKKAPKTCSICGKTEGEKLKGCKKASVMTILSAISLLSASLVLFRKKR